MKTYKITIFAMSILSIILFAIAFLFEFILPCSSISNFYVGIFQGIFSSAILVLICSIINYLLEKKRILNEIHVLFEEIIRSVYLIFMVNNSDSMELISKIEQLGISSASLIRGYSPFCKVSNQSIAIVRFFEIIKKLCTNVKQKKSFTVKWNDTKLKNGMLLSSYEDYEKIFLEFSKETSSEKQYNDTWATLQVYKKYLMSQEEHPND